MTGILLTLLKLQDVEFGSAKATQAQIEVLRKEVAAPILAHYDRLVARGKKGVAIVRNQVCTGCHMRLPIGTINTLMQGTDIQICDTCGRYLCLAPEPAPEVTPAKPASPAKSAAKPRKRKALTHAA